MRVLNEEIPQDFSPDEFNAILAKKKDCDKRVFFSIRDIKNHLGVNIVNECTLHSLILPHYNQAYTISQRIKVVEKDKKKILQEQILSVEREELSFLHVFVKKRKMDDLPAKLLEKDIFIINQNERTNDSTITQVNEILNLKKM